MFSLIDTGKHHIDSLWWCFTDGNETVYPSKVLPLVEIPKYKKWIEEGVDIVRIFIDETRRRGLEVFFSLRMNESTTGTDSYRHWVLGLPKLPESLPIKKAHPDWLIRAWPSSDEETADHCYLWNYAKKDVRELMLRCLREVAENYDVDGIDMDFCRNAPYLPVDQQWEHHEKLTDFVRSVRFMVQEIEQKRGRPFLLAARVPQTIDGARLDGFDLQSWAREKLVDIFVLGSRSIDVDLAGFRRITAGTDIKLYPCYDSQHTPDGYGDLPIEVYRGLVANWLSQGADGVLTFNFINVTQEACDKFKQEQLPPLQKFQKRLSRLDYWEKQEAFYGELGGPKLIRDKTFVIGRRGGGLGTTPVHKEMSAPPEDWVTPKWGYSLANVFHQLPATITNKVGVDTFVSLHVGDDVNAEAERVDRLVLRVLLSDPAGEGQPDACRLEPALVRAGGKLAPTHNQPPVKGIEKDTEARINGVLLGQATVVGGWLVFAVRPKQLALGRNLIGIRTTARAANVCDEIVIEKVELDVRYR